MSEPFIGQIQAFGFTFPPRGWVDCNGQLLSIAQYSALFSLFGTTYGGDGRTTFGLPDLRGRVPIHEGTGPGLSTYKLGQKGGAEQITLIANQVPSHTHPFNVPCNTGDGSTDEPQNNFPAKAGGGESIYAAAATPNATMGAGTTGQNAGGGQPHANIQPYLAIRFCCALVGLYPSRS